MCAPNNTLAWTIELDLISTGTAGEWGNNVANSNYLLFTFNRSDAANDDPNTAITVEYGNDLVGWTTAVDDNDNVEVEVTGIPNGVEMVVGGDPKDGMDSALLPTLELVNADPDGDTLFADYLLFTYRRSDLSVAAGVTADCETDTDLVAPWTPATGAPGVVIQVDDNFTFSPPAAAATDRVRVYVPRGSQTTLFGRLNVLVP